MSIRAMAYVWEHSKQKSTDLLMMLALADHCNDEGFCYPGVPRLAKKCRVSERTAQRILRKLVNAGELAIVIDKDFHLGRPNLYFLNDYRRKVGLPEVKSTKTFSGRVMTSTDTCDMTPGNTTPGDTRVTTPGDSHDTTPGDTCVTTPGDICDTTKLTNIVNRQKQPSHTHTNNSRTSEQPQKICVCVDENHSQPATAQSDLSNQGVTSTDNVLTEFEQRAWEWAQSHTFWKGRITNVSSLRKNLAKGTAFRVQFDEDCKPANMVLLFQPRPHTISPPSHLEKSVAKSDKDLAIEQCPYCDETGGITFKMLTPDGSETGRANPQCSHDEQRIKHMFEKLGAVRISTARKTHQNPFKILPVELKLKPRDHSETRAKLSKMIGEFKTE